MSDASGIAAEDRQRRHARSHRDGLWRRTAIAGGADEEGGEGHPDEGDDPARDEDRLDPERGRRDREDQ